LIVIFGLTCLYQLPMSMIGLDPFDEGIRLSGAERVLAGEVPYRDFYALYGPAHFYLPALLFRIFGAQILGLRLASLAVNAFGAVVVCCFCRAAGLGPRGTLLAYLLFLLPRAEYGAQLYLCDPALALILAAGALLISSPGISPRVFLTGVLLGGAMLFRHDFGVYGVIAAVGAIISLRDDRGPTRTRRLGLLLLGVLIVSGTGYGLLALGGLRPIIDCMIRYPTLVMPFRRLHYPASFVLRSLRSPPWKPPILVYLAPAVTLLLALGLLAPGLRGRLLGVGRNRSALIFALTLASGLSVYGFGRCDFQHLFPLYVVCVCVCLVLLRGYLGPVSPSIVTAFIGVGVLFAAASVAGTISIYRHCRPVPLEKARCIVTSAEHDPMIQAALDLSAIGDAERILVACQRHDRVFINALALYFLAGRRPGTYFAEFDPGLTTTRDVQQRIIDDLRKNRVQLVVVYHVTLPDEPNKSRVSSGVKLLDDYLSANYSPIKTHAEYSVLRSEN
jgi:hypothetical protein